MNIINKYTIITGLLIVFTLLTACRRTELCYDHFPKASMSFDWEQEWERDYGMEHQANWDAGHKGFDYDSLKPGIPEWVNVVKFRDNNPDGQQFLTPDGGDLTVSGQGEYSFLLYNGDTEYIILSDMASISNARASATQRSRASLTSIMEIHPDTRTTNPPDVLYSAFMDNVTSIGNHQSVQIPVMMKPLVYTYVIRYEFEAGLEHVHLARGALAGMAESVYLRDGKTSDESTIILYDCDVKNYGCEAHVRSFGVPGFPDKYYGRAGDDDTERPYTLNLELLLTNGTTLEFNYDIADQIKNQPRGGVITISGIRVEDEQNKNAGSSGFNVDLTGWAVEDIILPF